MTSEDKRAISDYIRKLAVFSKGDSRDCPFCGSTVTGAKLYEKHEPDMYSLYVLPCNCRLGLWGKAPDWITDVTIITLEDQDAAADAHDAKIKLARWNAACSRKGGAE